MVLESFLYKLYPYLVTVLTRALTVVEIYNLIYKSILLETPAI